MKRVFSCVVAASLALSLLVGCGASSTASSAASSAASSEAASSVASSAAETAALPDGVYTAEFDTDSSMFHANEACDGKGTLTVENGQMTFHVSLASTHIVNLYLGKAADAADHEADWLQPTTDTVTYSDGTSEEVYGFDIPVTAVDTDFDLAILGTKGKWYDHVVSVRNAVQQAGTAAPADGTYTCDVTLEGGSGRATVESPAALTVADGKMTATIVWSSPNYDYMIVDGEKYLLVAHLLPMDTILATSYPYLLGIIIISSGIEHKHPVTHRYNGRSFHTFTFPRVLRNEYGSVTSVLPRFPVE